MRKRTVRITTLGYFVLAVIILVMAVGIYFIIWSMRNANGVQGPNNLNSGSFQVTPTPALAPVSAATATPTATPTQQATTPQPTQSMTPKQDDTPEPEVKEPTPEQLKTAVDGVLNASGVVLRQGPAKNYTIIGTYSSGTQLKVYAIEGEFYLVKVVKENLYGYMAAKFVDKAGALPGEKVTPTPKAIAGTIPGTVSASSVALRTMPSKEGNDPQGELVKGDQVLIYFKTGDYYYIQVVATGQKFYAYASYITPTTAVPTGTPVP